MEKKRLQQKLNAKTIRFNMLMEKRSQGSAYQKYQAKIMARLG